MSAATALLDQYDGLNGVRIAAINAANFNSSAMAQRQDIQAANAQFAASQISIDGQLATLPLTLWSDEEIIRYLLSHASYLNDTGFAAYSRGRVAKPFRHFAWQLVEEMEIHRPALWQAWWDARQTNPHIFSRADALAIARTAAAVVAATAVMTVVATAAAPSVAANPVAAAATPVATPAAAALTPVAVAPAAAAVPSVGSAATAALATAATKAATVAATTAAVKAVTPKSPAPVATPPAPALAASASPAVVSDGAGLFSPAVLASVAAVVASLFVL